MLMEEIIKKNSKLAGMSFKKTPDSIILELSRPEGLGRMNFYTIFPGLHLAYIDIHTTVWPTIPPDNYTGQLLLNYCTGGRAEFMLSDDVLTYVAENDISFSAQTARQQFSFPLGLYQGFEFYFDTALLKQSDFLLHEFDLDILLLPKLYHLDETTYITRPNQETEHVLKNIWDFHEKPSLFHLRLYTLELLHLLSDSHKQPLPQTRTYYTGTQAEIAKKAEKIITADLRNHYPVRQLAEMFAISETSLKNYFRGVFGQNISSYIKEKKMKCAADLLTASKLPISEIAAMVGYANQGKFAAIFKQYYQLTPLDYRRIKSLEKINN